MITIRRILTRRRVITVLAAASCLLILIPIVLPYVHRESIRGRLFTNEGDVSYDRVGRSMIKTQIVTSAPAVMHSDDSSIYRALLRVSSGDGAPVLRPSRAKGTAGSSSPSCAIFAPAFENAQIGGRGPQHDVSTDYSCEWVISPKHAGRALVVASFTMPSGERFTSYDTIEVADFPFSLANVSTLVGVLAGIGAALAAFRARKGD